MESGSRALAARAVCAVVVAAAGIFVAIGAVAQQGGGDSNSGDSSAEKVEEVDHVALAATLVNDGHYDRAKTELEKVDPSNEDVDRPLYYTLRGLVALQNGADQRAVESFDDAIRFGQTDNRIFVHLAQAHYGLGNWEKVIQSVRNAADVGTSIPELYLMKAESQRKLDRLPGAWQTLEEGRERFPERSKFLRQQVFLLVEMELYQAALERGRSYLDATSDAAAEDYIAVAEAFRRAGEHRRAQTLLESARARYPDETEVLVHLAHAYIGAGDHVAGAELLQVAAESDPTYIRKSAELFRRAGARERALYMNARITDQAEKFEQRVAILLDRRDFERIATLDTRLSRLGLLEDAKIAYAVAYAHFKTRNYERAAQLTRTIESEKMFESAVELRRAIEECRASPWKC
jgi:tetratricopeptide (TPR) repeat protein